MGEPERTAITETGVFGDVALEWATGMVPLTPGTVPLAAGVVPLMVNGEFMARRMCGLAVGAAEAARAKPRVMRESFMVVG